VRKHIAAMRGVVKGLSGLLGAALLIIFPACSKQQEQNIPILNPVNQDTVLMTGVAMNEKKITRGYCQNIR